MLPLLHIFAPDMHVQRRGIHNFTAIYILKASSLPNCPRSEEIGVWKLLYPPPSSYLHMIKCNSPCIIYHKTRYGSYTISIDFATLLPPGPNFPWIRFYCWCAERILLEQILLSNNETTFCLPPEGQEQLLLLLLLPLAFFKHSPMLTSISKYQEICWYFWTLLRIF